MTCLSSYELFQMGRDSLAYWFCIFWLVMNSMYFQAASWFWLPFAMAMPMLPFTPGAPAGPFGVWAMSIWPATWLSLGSLARANMYVQFRAIAASPWEMIFLASSSRVSVEAGLESFSSRVILMNSRA